MTQLVLFLIAGAVLLLLFVLFALSGRAPARDETLPLGALENIVSLPGLAFGKMDLLLNDRDYRMLGSKPGLQRLARRLRQDRGRIILLWLELLQEDIRNLWRFRRLLVRNGISVGLGEECRIAATGVVGLALLFSLRVVVAAAGPFALVHLLRGARYQVETACRLCAELLSRVPPSGREVIARQWACLRETAEFGVPAGRSLLR
jgi:hypothetical protein